MKKLALIGMVVAGLLLSTSVALAKPTGMTNAEYQALIARSEGMNQKHGLVPSSRAMTPVDVNQKLEEIGAWAVPSKQTQSTPLVSEKLSGLNLPTGTTVASSGQGFDWNDAGIGAVLALGGVLGIGALLTVRHQHQHKPIAH
jgi:hypothetical protein